ncbi:hypothetical protein QYE76_001779 [Lolium multiflorum]|uniref:Dirigent protein n=1 Tax=Lolium multiflorum TaxID=4521 RepID=A0AAD8RLT7_LOLMU|nr:hypothetical protein QYE76_001779 [Lolium multiflorum]
MASLSSLLLASAFFLAGSIFFYRYDASGNKSGGTTTTAHLHFYMHDDYTGPRPTAKRVVSGRTSDDDNVTTTLKTAPRQFGDIVVLNNALTDGPSGGSARVGTAQGWAVRVSEGGIVSDLTLHLVLEAGEHRGSSLTVRGRIDILSNSLRARWRRSSGTGLGAGVGVSVCGVSSLVSQRRARRGARRRRRGRGAACSPWPGCR